MIQIFETASTNSQLVDSNWVSENDTVKITYWFWANFGVVSFAVYNKLNKPIYIDWKNSSFIYNGIKLDYWAEEEKISQSRYSSFYYRGPLIYPRMVSNESSVSTITKPEKVTFIPPRSYYYRSSFYLKKEPFEFARTPENQDTVPNYEKPEKKAIIYTENFNHENSLLKFRNYLAFSFSETSQDFFFFDNEFYLSTVMEMNSDTYKGVPIEYKKYSTGDQAPIFGKSPYERETSFFIK